MHSHSPSFHTSHRENCADVWKLFVFMKMKYDKLEKCQTIWGKLISLLRIQLKLIKWGGKGPSALYHPISASDINRLCLTCFSGTDAAHSDETSPKSWTQTPRDLSESAGALRSNEVLPAVQLTVKEGLSQIGLANSASHLISWHPKANTWWSAQANGNPNKTIWKIHTVYRFGKLLTGMLENRCKHTQMRSEASECSLSDLTETYIFTNKILLIFNDAPRSNADGADLPSRFGGVVL